jgi:hypothetical protein
LKSGVVVFFTVRSKNRRNDLSILKRKLRSVSVPKSRKLSNGNIPKIEILSVAAKKDFATLIFAMESAVENSINQIVKLTIVSPKKDIDEEFIRKLRGKLSGVEIIFVPEEDIIGDEIRIELRELFGARYGWILQQLLTIEFCLNSHQKGVLVLNADTILTQKKIWLDNKGQQILMPSLEFHPPYYDFLHKAFGFSRYPKYTFITHHMLFQPIVMRYIFDELGIKNLRDLLEKMKQYADLNVPSPVCLEFEIYGQGILKYMPEKTKLVRFSNIGIPRPEKLEEGIEKIRLEYVSNRKVNSISFHDYLT